MTDLQARRRVLRAATSVPDLQMAGALCAPQDRRLASMPDVLSLADLCALLDCSDDTIRRRLAAGTFPLAPLPAIDRRPRWSKCDVARWLDANQRASWPVRRRQGGRGR